MKAKIALSVAGLATTGGTFCTMLCRPSTVKFQVKIGFTRLLNQPEPQTSSSTQTMIQGSSALHTCSRVGFTSGSAETGGMVPADSSRVRSAGDSHSFFGCHTLRNRISAAIEISEAPMSTIHGLMKFEMTNWGMAKESAQTRIAGHTSFMPRQPAKAHTTQNGTIIEKKGSCRPTMAPSRYGSSPVTLARPTMGVPKAP